MLQTFEGFDERSPTLARSPLVGDCMRGIISREYAIAYIDRAAPIRSGDFVRCWIRYQDDEAVALVKRLRVSRAGTWWLECADGLAQVGTLVQPFNIERIVAFEEGERDQTRVVTRKASPEDVAHFAMLAQEAGVIEEWAMFGHVDGVPFPGLAVLNYRVLSGGVPTAEKSPTYRPPVPL